MKTNIKELLSAFDESSGNEDKVYYQDYVISFARYVAMMESLEFNDWLLLNCDLQPHGIYERFGEEYTIEDLYNMYYNEPSKRK